MTIEKTKIINRTEAFTLVEVLVAGFIMVLGFTSLSALVISMLQGANLSRHTMEATSIAQAKIEDIRSGGFENTTNGAESVESYYTLTWTSAVSSVSTIKDVSVATSWTDRHGVDHEVEIKTMLTEKLSGMGSMSFTNLPMM